MTKPPVLLVTGNDLAPEALELLKNFEVRFAGKQCSEETCSRWRRKRTR